MKKNLGRIAILLMVLGLALPVAYAHFQESAGEYGSCGWHGGHGSNLEGMFFHKAYFLLKAKDQIGLSEDQVQSIKNLTLETKKNMIRQEAEDKILKMDLESKLHSKKVDEAEVQKLIDQKYENKKIAAKSSLGAYLKLKNTLNDKQWEAVETLKKEKMKEWNKEAKG